jgi:SAM-dependent methyltransferase
MSGARPRAACAGRRTWLRAGIGAWASAAVGAGLAGLAPAGRAQAPAAPASEMPPDLDVPFVTTPDNVVVQMLAMAGVRAGEFVLDLGSGDGRIVITAARELGARGLGVEIDPSLVAQSTANARKAGVADRARFEERDLFDTDLGQADVITMYLLPDVNLKLRPALLRLRPGVRLVSHDWDMGDWLPDALRVVAAPQKKLGLRKEARLMAWVVPADVGGRHRAPGASLRIVQRYQSVDGGLFEVDGRVFLLGPARVRGAAVALEGRADDGTPVRLQATVPEARTATQRIAWRVQIGEAGPPVELLTQRAE